MTGAEPLWEPCSQYRRALHPHPTLGMRRELGAYRAVPGSPCLTAAMGQLILREFRPLWRKAERAPAPKSCQVMDTGASTGSWPGALPWQGQRERGGTNGICSELSLDR